jgi:V8-like Glu-specific endopeptidase
MEMLGCLGYIFGKPVRNGMDRINCCFTPHVSGKFISHFKIKAMKSILAFFVSLAIFYSTKGQVIKKLDTVVNTSIEPFSQICYQEIYRVRKFKKDRPFQSSGFLIAPNVVLTAAHNLYSDKWTKVTNITIYPGRYKETYSYDSIELSGELICQNTIMVHPNFYWKRANYDFGIIVIPDSIIKKTKNWPTKSVFTLDTAFVLKQGDTISVAGFPADPKYKYDGSLMTYEVQKCGNVAAKTFSHEFDTQTGNSGSPIWVEINGERKIVGVHTYAVTGTKIDKEYIKMILSWIDKKNLSLTDKISSGK